MFHNLRLTNAMQALGAVQAANNIETETREQLSY